MRLHLEDHVNTSDFKAVIFDLGGVVLASPLHTIAQFEERAWDSGRLRQPTGG